MDMNGIGALSAYAYQTALTQTGSTSQALTQALAAGQSQAGETGALLASAGAIDPTAALAGGAGSQALTSLAYAASASAGNGPEAVQAMLASLGGSRAAVFSSSDGLPISAAALAPNTTEALVRYAYDRSQSQETAAQQAAASGQQSLLTTNLNLLA